MLFFQKILGFLGGKNIQPGQTWINKKTGTEFIIIDASALNVCFSVKNKAGKERTASKATRHQCLRVEFLRLFRLKKE